MTSTSFRLTVALAVVLAACAGDPAARECASGIFCPEGTTCAAAQAVCIINKCGNAILDNGEVCDDGNILDGDGCSHDCSSKETCGNGIKDPEEQCDDGNTADADGCSAHCTIEMCGNGIKDAGEACDDGNTTDADGCSANCKSTEVCGNGIKDVEVGEICDDGNTSSGDGCNADCRSGEGCKNGILDPGEQCDDGDSNDNNDCRNDCKPNVCGDGVLDSAGTRVEQCDAGVVGTTTPIETATCNRDCTTATCGDGKLNPKNVTAPALATGEQCDDGNQVNGDGCDNNCTITGCGNDVVEGTEACDDGNKVNGDNCDNNCKLTACGNGIVTGAEACDDGNTNSNDGCSAGCVVERCGDGVTNNVTEQCDASGANSTTCNADCTTAACGDGKFNPLFVPSGAPGGEQCDDHNTANNDGCSSKCQFERCGDGVKNNVIEACDTSVASQTCNADCTLPSCGDGKLNPAFTPSGAAGPEQCDDGGTADGDGCSSECQFERCGNNLIDPGEQCDGAPVGGFACLNCHLVKCGNGILEAGEQCDDGNASATDDCVSDSTTPANCKLATCGDNHVDASREQCDHGATNGMVGDTCSATCRTVMCGDGIVEQGETCDDGAGNNGAGKACNVSCHRNVCGDSDVLTGIEQCDSGGVDTASCDADCTSAVCGDGHKNTLHGEACDNGALNGTVGNTCDSTCHMVGCGNGFDDVGEACDPGTPNTNTATCDKDCTTPTCGDGLTNGPAGESCDDGANNGNPCAYGDESCTRCNKDCTGMVSPGGPYCGDATQQGVEMCDQGDLNGTKCGYGDLTCLNSASSICKATCDGFMGVDNGTFCGDNIVQATQHEQCDPSGGTAPLDKATCDNDCTFVVCGDGHRNMVAGEACDDGNSQVCGSCSATCGAVTLAAATGSITTVDDTMISDGDSFTLDDGVHAATVFEFRKAGSASGGHVKVTIAMPSTATQVRDAIITAVNGVTLTLSITAAIGSATSVSLTNNRQTSLGNVAIQTSATPNYSVAGMSGGLGGDCPTNVGCVTGSDCASGTCNPATGRCQ